MYSVADQIVDILNNAGIKRIYGIVGDSLNPITDALRKNKKIEWVHVRHEEAAAFAASAEAQLTGNLAVCCGSSGPGNLHLINGLFDAQRSRARVLAIASHIPQSEIGSEYFQATHPEHLFKECSHYCELASEPVQVPYVLQQAIQQAYSKHGVGVLVLPGDIAAAPASSENITKKPSFTKSSVTPAPEDIAALAKLINEHEKVTFFCGEGCAGSQGKIISLAQKVKAPIAYSWRGKEHMEHNNPFAVGMTGLLGWGDAYDAMHKSDLIILWGTDFPYRNFIPSSAKIAQIDIRGERLGRRCNLELGLCGDTGSTVDALLPLVDIKKDDGHLKSSLKRHAHAVKKMAAYNEGAKSDKKEKTPIRPEHLTTVIDRQAKPDAVFTVDTGTPCMWAARFLHTTENRRFLASFIHGSMANAMPMAMGAQSEYPNRQVIALCGDGGLSMLAGDLITHAQYKLPVKLVVYNNDCLDFIQIEMEAAGLVPSEIDLHNPSFAALAETIGFKGFRLEDPAAVEQTVEQFLAHPGPALLDAVVDRDAIALPPYISMKQAASFSLSMAKQTMLGDLKQVWRTLMGNRKLFY